MDFQHGPRRRRNMADEPFLRRFYRRMNRLENYEHGRRSNRGFTTEPIYDYHQYHNGGTANSFGVNGRQIVGEVTYLGRRQGSSHGGDEDADNREHFALARMRTRQNARERSLRRMSARRLLVRQGLPSDVLDFLG